MIIAALTQGRGREADSGRDKEKNSAIVRSSPDMWTPEEFLSQATSHTQKF